jgi:hypothetical protein
MRPCDGKTRPKRRASANSLLAPPSSHRLSLFRQNATPVYARENKIDDVSAVLRYGCVDEG